MWLYKDKEINSIEDFPEGTHGFIYEVTHKPTGKKYIGKKVLYFTRNVKLGKRELEQLKEERKSKGIGGRVPQKKQVVKESDWKTYYGSHPFIKSLIKSGKQLDFSKEILILVGNKKLLTYYENKTLFSRGVLECEDYINDNIEGRYYKKDFVNTEDFTNK